MVIAAMARTTAAQAIAIRENAMELTAASVSTVNVGLPSLGIRLALGLNLANVALLLDIVEALQTTVLLVTATLGHACRKIVCISGRLISGKRIRIRLS